jgi:hypothetical protein
MDGTCVIIGIVGVAVVVGFFVMSSRRSGGGSREEKSRRGHTASPASMTASCGHTLMICGACGARGCTKSGCTSSLVNWTQSSACLRCGNVVAGFKRA